VKFRLLPVLVLRPVPGGGRGQAGAEISRPCVYGGLWGGPGLRGPEEGRGQL